MHFINEAFAEGAVPQSFMGLSQNFSGLLPIFLIFIIFYFLLIRPQQKKLRDHKEMLGALKRGDKVVTAGGIIGRVEKVDAEPNIVLLEIAPNLQVKIIKSTISEVLNKPVAEEKK